MIILNRKIKPSEIPQKLFEFGTMGVRSLRFEKPVQMWKGYLLKRPPVGNKCRLRNGLSIQLSSNPHDVITVMVNFCRGEYGHVRQGSTVVDIGGNIGAFSLYAADAGASRVIGFEPNQEAFDVFRKNIAENKLEGKVEVRRLAVSGQGGEIVYLPKNSSPYNKLVSEGTTDSTSLEPVTTISLAEIIDQNDIEQVDLLKMDCEGAEYEILMKAPKEALTKIREIRMELHPSRVYARSDLVQHLEVNGFELRKHSGMIYWFKRK